VPRSLRTLGGTLRWASDSPDFPGHWVGDPEAETHAASKVSF